MMIKTLNAKTLIIGLCWLISLAAVFAGGVFFRIAYYVYPNPIHSYQVLVDGAPSPDGPRYSAAGIVEANRAAENLILKSGLRRKNFEPEFIVTPEESGYTVHMVSGTDGTNFPSDLLESIQKSTREILESDFEKRLRSAEQAEPANRR